MALRIFVTGREIPKSDKNCPELPLLANGCGVSAAVVPVYLPLGSHKSLSVFPNVLNARMVRKIAVAGKATR